MKIRAILVLIVLLLSMGSVNIGDVQGHRGEVILGDERSTIPAEKLTDASYYTGLPQINIPKWRGTAPTGTATFSITHDKQFLYIFIDFISDQSKDLNDAAWISIDTLHLGSRKPQTTDWTFGIEWFGEPLSPNIYVDRGDGNKWPSNFSPPGIVPPTGFVGITVLDKNMKYAFRIPKTIFTEIKDIFGLRVALRNGPPEPLILSMIWPANVHYEEPNTWGDIRLKELPTREKISSTFNSEQCVLDGKWTTKTEYEKSLKISMKDTAGNNIDVFIRHNDESICIILHWLAKKVVYGAEVVSTYFDRENNIATTPDKDDISFSYLFIDEKKGKVFMENSTGISWGEDYDYSMIATHSDDISNSPYKDRHYMVEFKISWSKDLQGYKDIMGFRIATGSAYPRTIRLAQYPATATRDDPRTWAELTFPKETIITTTTQQRTEQTTPTPKTTVTETTPTKPAEKPATSSDYTLFAVAAFLIVVGGAVFIALSRSRKQHKPS